jgi:hypothetical protein
MKLPLYLHNALQARGFNAVRIADGCRRGSGARAGDFPELGRHLPLSGNVWMSEDQRVGKAAQFEEYRGKTRNVSRGWEVSCLPSAD